MIVIIFLFVHICSYCCLLLGTFKILTAFKVPNPFWELRKPHNTFSLFYKLATTNSLQQNTAIRKFQKCSIILFIKHFLAFGRSKLLNFTVNSFSLIGFSLVATFLTKMYMVWMVSMMFWKKIECVSILNYRMGRCEWSMNEFSIFLFLMNFWKLSSNLSNFMISGRDIFACVCQYWYTLGTM